METAEQAFLQLVNITRSFPGVLANDHISLEVRRGEIYALLGENGAGKTTLMNVVYGLLPPDEGQIFLNGKAVKINSPREAIHLRIGMVHQHFMLEPTLTVAENIILGMRPLTALLLDLKSIENDILRVAKKFGMKIDPSALVSRLSVGEQQRVEIVKALYKGVDLLILDEPTAVLTPQEAYELFKTLRDLTAKGLSIIFITHKLNEVMAVADRVTVLRDGKLIDTRLVSQTNQNELAHMMVNREVSFTVEKPCAELADTVLAVEDLSVTDNKGLSLLKSISLKVRSGEILGLAGVDGNGQKELVLVITGLLQPGSGKILLGNEDITYKSVMRRIEVGLSHIPEDRHSMGLVLDFSVADNLVLQNYHQPPYTRHGFINRMAINEHAREIIKTYDIRTRTSQTKASHLSGGNQQKLVVGRELDRKPKLLVAFQPTRGLDIGATEYIHNKLIEKRCQGAAVLLISTELEEILSLSDRIAVIYEGQIVGELDCDRANIQRIGRMMAGLGDDEKGIA